MQEGQEVTVTGYLGQVRLVVVRVLGTIVLACKKEEYESAKKEGREPISTGISLKDVTF